MYRGKPVQQIVAVHLAIGDDDGAGLGDKGGGFLSPDVPDMRPEADVGTEGYVVDRVHAQPPEIGKQPFVAGDIGLDRGRGDNRNGHPPCQVIKKARGIVGIYARAMPASRDTPAAGYAFIVVDYGFYIAGFLLKGQIGQFHGAFPHAAVASRA
jgi:hypothetical protein